MEVAKKKSEWFEIWNEENFWDGNRTLKILYVNY